MFSLNKPLRFSRNCLKLHQGSSDIRLTLVILLYDTHAPLFINQFSFQCMCWLVPCPPVYTFENCCSGCSVFCDLLIDAILTVSKHKLGDSNGTNFYYYYYYYDHHHHFTSLCPGLPG